jgi:hypothetical protein
MLHQIAKDFPRLGVGDWVCGCLKLLDQRGQKSKECFFFRSAAVVALFHEAFDDGQRGVVFLFGFPKSTPSIFHKCW